MYSNVSLEKGHRKVARVGESGGCTTVQFHTEESVPELACLHKVQQEGGVEGGGNAPPFLFRHYCTSVKFQLREHFIQAP